MRGFYDAGAFTDSALESITNKFIQHSDWGKIMGADKNLLKLKTLKRSSLKSNETILKQGYFVEVYDPAYGAGTAHPGHFYVVRMVDKSGVLDASTKFYKYDNLEGGEISETTLSNDIKCLYSVI